MSRSRRHELPVESSWRMVEGEHDSFDTSIVPDDDEDTILSSGPSQLSSQSQGTQGNWSIGGSQDDSTIEDFISKAEDEQVILRSPFQPSMPNAVRRTSRDNANSHSPDPEFYMPRVEVESPRRGSSTRSSRTIRPGDGLRQRQPPTSAMPRRKAEEWNGRGNGQADSKKEPGMVDRMSSAIPSALFEIIAWALGTIGMAVRYAQKPLAAALAIYLVFGGLIMAQNMATKSLYASLSPLCRLPGVSLLVDLPFCKMSDAAQQDRQTDVEYDGLMKVQNQFEDVLEKSASGVALPLEMKRSESSIRDLRTLIKYSDLQVKDELVFEFDGLIDMSKTAANDLQMFNTHVGSAVDSVISVNRWTSRYLDGLVTAEATPKGLISDFTSWIFTPFQPAVFSERDLLNHYVEHTTMVSEKIEGLIVEAHGVLRTLEQAEDHLEVISDLVMRTDKDVQARKTEVLWSVWTVIGANMKDISKLNAQLSLLKRADTQRTTAVRQVSDLIFELVKIQAGLEDLRERVAEPGLAVGSGSNMPLSVHIETIGMGIDRLEDARRRIRAEENDQIQKVIAKGNKGLPEIGA